MRRATPYSLVLKYYWFRLAAVSVIWFLYDVSSLGQSPCPYTTADRFSTSFPHMRLVFTRPIFSAPSIPRVPL